MVKVFCESTIKLIQKSKRTTPILKKKRNEKKKPVKEHQAVLLSTIKAGKLF